MENLDQLLYGFSVALTWHRLLLAFVGVVIGTLVGILPGLGTSATVALLLPVTLTLDPTTGFIMLAGVFYGSKYGGSTTSILLNTPGEPSSVATTLDGYALARAGRAGAALGMAAIASFVAGTIGVIGLTFLAPLVADWAVSFGPPEYFGLTAFGLVLIVMLVREAPLRGFISAVLGLLLASVGTDIFSGRSRFTMGSAQLLDGIDFVPLTVGVFAIAEVLINLEQRNVMHLFPVPKRLRDLLPTWDDLRQSRIAVLQGSVVGFLVGALPGAGATVSSFIAYAFQKRLTPNPQTFGHGAIDGVAAPEAANNSETGGALVPLLTLGIPGSGTTAVLLGGMILYGLRPGPLLFSEQPELVWGLIASMYIGNVMLLVLNLPLVPVFASLLRLPYYVIFPGILILSVIGTYAVNNQPFDVLLMTLFGGLGYVMRKLGIPAAPLVLAFVLSPIAERALRGSLIISSGDWSIFLTRPISVVLLVGAVLTIVLPSLIALVRRQRAGWD